MIKSLVDIRGVKLQEGQIVVYTHSDISNVIIGKIAKVTAHRVKIEGTYGYIKPNQVCVVDESFQYTCLLGT